MDDLDMANVEPLRSFDGNLFQRVQRKHRMMLKHQAVNRVTVRGARSRNAGEADNGPVAARAPDQGREFLVWPDRVLLEARNYAHPPDTGGRNSTRSPSEIT